MKIKRRKRYTCRRYVVIAVVYSLAPGSGVDSRFSRTPTIHLSLAHFSAILLCDFTVDFCAFNDFAFYFSFVLLLSTLRSFAIVSRYAFMLSE